MLVVDGFWFGSLVVCVLLLRLGGSWIERRDRERRKRVPTPDPAAFKAELDAWKKKPRPKAEHSLVCGKCFAPAHAVRDDYSLKCSACGAVWKSLRNDGEAAA